jgi:geranylgeranyl diphosphate synthase type I
MVEGKTSGLFALPMAGAALVCGAPSEVVDGLAEAARHMGVLFQVQDDVLDLYGSKGRGAPGSDIAEGKRSALVLHGMQTLPPERSAWLEDVLDQPRDATSPEDVTEAIDMLRACGSLAFALGELERRRVAAQTIPNIAAQPALAELVAGMCRVFLAPIQAVLGDN